MASKRKTNSQHETDEEDVEFLSEEPKKKQVKKPVYMQKYKSEYQVKYPCMRPSAKKGEHFAYCTHCDKDVSVSHAGLNDLKKHVETAVHKENEKLKAKTPSVASMFHQQQSPECLKTKITRAEAIMCGLVAEQNFSLSVVDTFKKALPIMFPDSKIAAGEFFLFFCCCCFFY